MVFPVVLRGLPGTSTRNRPHGSSTSKPVVPMVTPPSLAASPPLGHGGCCENTTVQERFEASDRSPGVPTDASGPSHGEGPGAAPRELAVPPADTPSAPADDPAAAGDHAPPVSEAPPLLATPENPCATPAESDAAVERGTTAPPAPPKPGWKRAAGVLAAAGVLLVKFGTKLKGLLFLLPKLKLFSTSFSMLISIGAYALIWGWRFAVGFVLLLLVHEYGHVLQLRREGIKATAPMFIPFLGAFVGMKEMPPDAAAEARVGLAGPVLGSLGCLVPLAIYLATGSEMFLALAFVGFFLNLFNLMPVLPLDGGRAMAVLSPWLWVLGFAMLIGATIAFPNPIMPLILILGGFETFRRFRARRSPESQRYARVPPRTRAAVAAVYAGLAVALAIGMDLTFVARGVGGS